MTDPRFLAADGTLITDGATLFNYYDRCLVVVEIVGTYADPTHPHHASWDGWFETGGKELNGERMCDVVHARHMGWLKD